MHKCDESQISTQLRGTQMQSYKCNEKVCVLKDLDARIKETHKHGNKLHHTKTNNHEV